MDGFDGNQPQIPRAIEKSRWWGGWIWAVPIAAVAIVLYLAIQQLSRQGPLVIVTFATAGGVQAGDTKVKFHGLDVGDVESVTLGKDLNQVTVSLRMHADMAGHLGPGTRFWLAGTKPDLTNLSTLKSIISGPYIGIDPREGEQQKRYQGLASPPVVSETDQGSHFVLSATTIGAISAGSSIYYRDLQVGKVESTQLSPDGKEFTVSAFVRAPFDKLVRDNTRFWNASAVQVSMASNGPKLAFQSLPALFAGAIGFETPDATPGQGRAKDGAKFGLYDSKAAAENAPDRDFVDYRVTFHAADAGGLDTGAPVRLARTRVGSVRDSVLEYDPATRELESLVTIAIDPSRIVLAGGAAWQPEPRRQMDDMMRGLIADGLRARTSKTVPLVGGGAVLLDFVPDAREASLGSGDIPEIPTVPGSDISGLIASISGVGAKLDAMPLDQIAREIHETTQQLAALSNSPETRQSLEHLDATISNVDQVAKDARGEIKPVLTELRGASTQAEKAVVAAKTLLSSNGLVGNQPETAGLASTLYELAQAARSLRELTDFLDEHPEALLKGKDR